MSDDDWEAGATVLQVFLNGEGILTPAYHGERVVDDSFLLVFNPTGEDVEVTLPDGALADAWLLRFDTSEGQPSEDEVVLEADQQHSVTARSTMVLTAISR